MSADSSQSELSFSLFSADYYYVLLLDASGHSTKVLSYFDQHGWCLPYFEYSEVLVDGNGVPTVCNDFVSWLQIKKDGVYFTASVELIGNRCAISRINPENTGRAQLLLVEPHGIATCQLKLPIGAEWKQIEFVQNFLDTLDPPLGRIMAKAIVPCIDPSGSYLSALSDERYRPRWFERASRYFVELVSSIGGEIESRVFQSHMSCTSTMLQMNTSLGRYYLKSPARGCNETEVTAAIAELFPDVSPNIVGVSKELNCFVSEEFDVEEPVDIGEAVTTLGRLQMESIKHVKRLCEAGCPIRDMEALEKAARNWPQEFRDYEYNTDTAETILPVIEELCNELKKYNIPMTLVHGDFNTNNTCFRNEGKGRNLILFDWEYAYIGHPFCDFHRIHNKISTEVLDEYLGMWSEYEDIERARCAYKVATKIGIAIRAWSFLEWSKACNAQDPPYMLTFACQAAGAFEAKACPW